jgi:hypothetical protein
VTKYADRADNRTTNQSDELLQSVFDATFIILLYDPEHLTAANYRKRRLLSRLAESRGRNEFRYDIDNDIRQELHFLDSILTSPLHRQSKSPTLWYHRWWLLSAFSLQAKVTVNIRVELLNAETSSILAAAERHSNNYYAWQHFRRVLLLKEDLSSTPLLFKSGGQHQLLNRISEWCFRNPSDTSGWSALLTLLDGKTVSRSVAEEKVSEMISFASQISWEQEALWTAIRTAIRPGFLLPEGVCEEKLRQVRELAKGKGLKVPYLGSANRQTHMPKDEYW